MTKKWPLFFSPRPRHRAGWFWLVPRVAKHHLLAARPAPFSPPIPFCSGKSVGENYCEITPALTHRFDPIPVSPRRARRLWDRVETISSAPFYQMTLRNAVVWGTQGWIGTADGHLLNDIFTEPTDDDWRVQACAAANDTSATRTLAGTTASLAMPNHTNYFHWLWQGVTRASPLLAHAKQIDHWIVPPADRPYVTESLDALGVPREKRVHAGAGCIRCEKLLVVSQPPTASFTAAACWPGDFLRQLFSAPTTQPHDHLFVVRGRVSARQLLNEDEISAHLAQRGFRTVRMDGLTVREQAALFASAKSIVGVHGAALANLVFCRPRTCVIELLPRNWASPLYARLATSLGLDYRCLAGCEPAFNAFPIRNLSADLWIDRAELTSVLDASG